MIDYFALALTHALILFALLRVLGRSALDREEWDFSAPEEPVPEPEPSQREQRRVRRERGRDA